VPRSKLLDLTLDHPRSTFKVAGLRSGNTQESFDALSGGAQEQLALLVRVGLAEVLCETDILPLVLDDALINSDAQRIHQLQRLLFRASRKLQILILTCHEPLFDTLGADYVISLPVTRRW
jgi:uncharacterized protein YhaN